MQRSKLTLAAIGPGLLLAATGVGGGDMATGTFVGSLLGTAILWAVIVGAFLKFVVTEGIARWQLATGNTFLEGLVRRLGPAVIWVFLPYLLLWTLFVGSAQMSACGVALYALLPYFDDPDRGKIIFGIICSLVGIGLVLKGGYRLFEAIMRVCIAIMFVTVVITAVMLWPGTGAVLQGLLVPTIPDFSGIGLTWTVALIGGVGGTLTVVCYGYWMREEGRTGPEDLWICRLDLGAGYLMTAIFGVAMVIVGSTVEIEGQGTTLLVTLAERLEEPLGGCRDHRADFPGHLRVLGAGDQRSAGDQPHGKADGLRHPQRRGERGRLSAGRPVAVGAQHRLLLRRPLRGGDAVDPHRRGDGQGVQPGRGHYSGPARRRDTGAGV